MILTPAQLLIQRVICAACRKGGVIICSPRHMDSVARRVIDQLEEDDPCWYTASEQGFVDQFGNFLTRQEAWIVAERAGQIKNRCGGDGVKLFSENLY